MKKPSFLERLTGGVNLDNVEDDGFEEEAAFKEPSHDEGDEDERSRWNKEIEEEADGELPIDMYQTGDAVVIRALVAGVNPNDLDITITRDMVTLKGRREEIQEAPDENYLHRELFWGSFSRTILLPEEVLIDEAEARERNGLLELILPKVDKERTTKLKVSSK